MKPRVEEFAVMRGLAIIGIVLLHVTSYFLGVGNSGAPTQAASLFLNQSLRFCLPMFLVLSGFGLAYNYQESEQGGWRGFYAKRVKQVVLPYVLWSVIYFLFYILVLEKIPVGTSVNDLSTVTPSWLYLLRVFLINLIFGWNYVHLYFVILILQFYLLFPLVIKNISPIKRKELFLIVNFALYVLLLIYLFYFRKLTGNTVVDIFVRYYWEIFVSWYVYFLSGIVIGLHLEKFRLFAQKNFTAVSLLYFLTLAWVIYEAFTLTTGIGRLTSLRPSVFFNTIPAVLFYYRLGSLIRAHLPKFFNAINGIGSWSFGIYFVYLLVLAILSTYLNRLLPSIFHFGSALFLVVLYVLTLTASVILVLLISRIPYAGYLSGMTRRDR